MRDELTKERAERREEGRVREKREEREERRMVRGEEIKKVEDGR